MSKIVYLGHASFLLQGNDFSVVFDPYRHGSVPNLKFPRNIEANEVLCSHDHYDHNAADFVKIIPTNKEITVLKSLVPHDHNNGKDRGMNLISMVEVDGLNVVHLGDTGCVLDKKTLLPFIDCDVLLAPINGFFTISPKELKEICEVIKPRIVIPMHYYMKEYQSGYSDGEMIEVFKRLFPDYQYLEGTELDLNEYKDYHGALIFKNYRQ